MAFDPPNFYNSTRKARKVIVVDLGFLGDSVHLVPALWEIKRHYPEAELHTLSAPVGRELLDLAPCVDRAWAFPLGPKSPPWWRHWDIIRALRRERFDLAFNFSGADRTIFLTGLTGARWRLGQMGSRQHFWSSWFIPWWVPHQNLELPVYEQRRQVLAGCGLDLAPARFDLRIPAEAASWASSNVPPGAVHFSINASTPLKEWPLENWIALAKTMCAQKPDLRIFATGSARPREQTRLQDFAAALGPAVRVHARLPIAQLAALISRCSLHVGADSGVLHVAMALGTPTVSLFRDYPALKEWLPRGPQHKFLSVACSCLEQKEPPCREKPLAACLAGLTPESVAALVREQLEGASAL